MNNLIANFTEKEKSLLYHSLLDKQEHAERQQSKLIDLCQKYPLNGIYPTQLKQAVWVQAEIAALIIKIFGESYTSDPAFINDFFVPDADIKPETDTGS